MRPDLSPGDLAHLVANHLDAAPRGWERPGGSIPRHCHTAHLDACQLPREGSSSQPGPHPSWQQLGTRAMESSFQGPGHAGVGVRGLPEAIALKSPGTSPQPQGQFFPAGSVCWGARAHTLGRGEGSVHSTGEGYPHAQGPLDIVGALAARAEAPVRVQSPCVSAGERATSPVPCVRVSPMGTPGLLE